jgi:zinc/manganese transport system substrate-binding protein
VSYHKSFAYLSEWLGLKEVAYLEPKPGIPPNPAHVAHVLATARKLGVRAILQESFYPSATAELVAEKSGAKLVVVPGGVDFRGGEKVTAHFTKIVEALEAAK